MFQRPPIRGVLALLTAIAVVAAAGSLYFSEGLGLVPCELCWFQRILMYPLVVVLGVAAYENRPGGWRTALPLSLGGIAVATYHSWLQVASTGTCSLGGGCTSIQYSALGGIVTIPRLALLAFVLVSIGSIGLALVDRNRPR